MPCTYLLTSRSLHAYFIVLKDKKPGQQILKLVANSTPITRCVCRPSFQHQPAELLAQPMHLSLPPNAETILMID